MSGDWDRTRMADVAARAGVSRQTLYNEFGNKDGLAAALALREAGRLLELVDGAVVGATSPGEAIRVTVLAALVASADNPLIKTALTGTHSSELLPFLTTRGEPTIQLADQRLALGMHERFPAIPLSVLQEVADVVVRLTISHVVTPAGAPEHVAASIERLVTPLLEV